MDAGFTLGWELDVWGRLRRLSEAARAQYLATDEARHGVLTTLVADVTQTYLSLRALDFELEIATRTRDVGHQEHAAHRRSDGRPASQAAWTCARPSSCSSPRRDRLPISSGRSRRPKRAEPAARSRCPATCRAARRSQSFQRAARRSGRSPSALLERRPDIRQAEQEFIAANAEIGVAKAEYFPRISLTGFLGGQSRALSRPSDEPLRESRTVGLGATAPIFNAGRTRSDVQLAEAVQREALVNYQRVIYTALRDVADSLTEYTKTSQQRAEQERLVEALRASSQLSHRALSGWIGQLPARCSMRSGISFKASWTSRSSASASSRRSSSCTARSAADGRSRDASDAGRSENAEKKTMAKRHDPVLIVLVVAFIATLAFVKFQAVPGHGGAVRRDASRRPRPSRPSWPSAEQWPATLSAIGTVAAVQGVTVSADLPGIVDRIGFDSGQAGQRRATCSSSSTRARSRPSSRPPKRSATLARLNFERMQALVRRRCHLAAPTTTAAAAEHKQAEARVGEIHATIERKTIRAPFSGVLGIRAGQPRPIPRRRRRGRAAAVAASRST